MTESICKGASPMGGSMTISAELVQDAETQLLEFARGQGSSIFSLTIVARMTNGSSRLQKTKRRLLYWTGAYVR